MVCPNCGYAIQDEVICPSCGVDPVLLLKTIRMSDTLFNRGLSQAKADDLSGAIDSLTKSLEFNKNNVHARNLLGLVFFEVGRIGDALKHWVISGSLLREGNPAVRYLDIIQKNSRTLEHLNDAVKMYNNALEYLRQKSDDMAIIQLKKSVEINPKFIDAQNLLTLCHFIQRNIDKAKATTERVLSMDMNNQIALHYYKEVNPSKIRPEPVQTVKKPSGTPFKLLQPTDRKSFGEAFHLTEILSFLVGCVCAFAILYVLVVPGVTAAKEDEIDRLRSSALTDASAAADEKRALEERIQQLENENLRLTQENNTFGRQVSLQDKLQRIEDAKELSEAGQAVEAASLLSSMDVSDLPAEAALEAVELQMQVYPLAARAHYDEALRRYNTLDYAGAKESLESCKIYVKDDAEYMDGFIYYSGMLAEEDGDLEAARGFYNTVISDYPNSTYVTRVNNRLNGMEEA